MVNEDGKEEEVDGKDEGNKEERVIREDRDSDNEAKDGKGEEAGGKEHGGDLENAKDCRVGGYPEALIVGNEDSDGEVGEKLLLEKIGVED